MLALLPHYADLQWGVEAVNVDTHLQHGVPDLRVESLAAATEVGALAYAMASLRQRCALSAPERALFDEDFSARLRRR